MKKKRERDMFDGLLSTTQDKDDLTHRRSIKTSLRLAKSLGVMEAFLLGYLLQKRKVDTVKNIKIKIAEV